MKLLSSDFLALGISAIIISTFSVLLYADFTKKIEVDGVKQIGTITFKREIAQRKYQSQVVWEEVKQSYPVYNNDSIRTSEDSESGGSVPRSCGHRRESGSGHAWATAARRLENDSASSRQ